MPTFHLLEYNNDYSVTMTSRTLWKYHRLKLSNDDNHINSVINSNYLKYKTNITKNTRKT